MLVTVALYALAWSAFHLGAGYVAYRLSARTLARLPVVSASYAWERGGRLYEPLGIRAWKDRLPEAGDFFQGGISKRDLGGRDAAHLERFALETSRAEYGHWLTWALSVSFFAWTPWPIGVFMVVFGGLVNLPFIMVQRYNRARLRRLGRRSARRIHPDTRACR